MDFFGLPHWIWTLVCFSLAGWFAWQVPEHLTSFRDRYGFSVALVVLGVAVLLVPLSPELVPSLALLALLVASLFMRGKK
ncbi:hypothetical protein [Deinococcus cellulosilyticus]|uniref:Uncharacterized protein n=1 Tax=Deinococcus cellulosilyticus (strain DSM 18568 / NBRC 106333 / KACC 11606 / 5516J-15) TaxID=1223518 RepID=A0A511N5V8_DEIC1|nr:hypothetical protein [Deinococcus cellulosilyticus]GEM48250.1 hypothetical protein DC3_38850 [Deinococcus cellulosilyticus NBRC 106333 = KACC 11606]